MRELLRSWWPEPRPAAPSRGWRDRALVVAFATAALLRSVTNARRHT